MTSDKLKNFLDNPMSLQEAMTECCKNISLAAQLLAKEKLELEHIKILINLAESLDRVTYTKYLTISVDTLDLYEKASTVEEAAEGIMQDLKEYIYGGSNKASNVITYLEYAIRFHNEMSDERIAKLYDVITTKFNGKKIDKRKG